MTEVLEKEVRSLRIFWILFFRWVRVCGLLNWKGERGFRWQDDWRVTAEEVGMAIRGKKKVKTAPGLDGISAAILRRLPRVMLDRLAECFSACMRRGFFPDQ